MKFNVEIEPDLGDLSGEIASLLAVWIRLFVERIQKNAICIPGKYMQMIATSDNLVKFYNHELPDAMIERYWNNYLHYLTGIANGFEIYAKGEHRDFEEIGERAFERFGKIASELTI